MADMSPSLTSSGQCPHCGAYNFQKAIICVRCSQVINKLFMDTESEGMSSPQTVYDDAISGDQRLFFKAARTCMTYQSADLLQNLRTTYFETHPLTRQKVKLGEDAKGQILMAMGLIRLPQTGSLILEIIKKDSWNALNEMLGLYATYALSIYQPDQLVIDYLVKEKGNSVHPLERYYCYEAAKKSKSPSTLQTILKDTDGDIMFLAKKPSPSFVGGLIGLALNIRGLYIESKQMLNSALTSLIAVAPMASPIEAEGISPDIQYVWSLQRRVDTAEALTERFGNAALSAQLTSFTSQKSKLLAACVIQRRSPGLQSWLQPVIEAALDSSLFASRHHKVLAVDTIIKLGDLVPVQTTRKIIESDFGEIEPYAKLATSMSIVINRRTEFFQDVIQLKNSPDSNIRIGTALAIYTMALLHPEMNSNLRDIVHSMVVVEQNETIRNALEGLVFNWDSRGDGTIHDLLLQQIFGFRLCGDQKRNQ